MNNQLIPDLSVSARLLLALLVAADVYYTERTYTRVTQISATVDFSNSMGELLRNNLVDAMPMDTGWLYQINAEGLTAYTLLRYQQNPELHKLPADSI